jgi:hypothetical protein
MKETKMQERSAVLAAIRMARSSSTKQEDKDERRLKQRGTRSRNNCKERFVIPYEGQWAIRVERSHNIQGSFSTKKLAIEQAKREAFLIGAAVTIFKRDGSIEKRILYNPDTKSRESESSKTAVKK